MVCVVCSCCATSPYTPPYTTSPRKEVRRAQGAIESGETLCHDDYRPGHTAGNHLLSVVQAATNTERLWSSEASISQRSQIKEDTVEPSACPRI